MLTTRRAIPLLLILAGASPAWAHKGHKPTPAPAAEAGAAPNEAGGTEAAPPAPPTTLAPKPAPPSRDAILRGAVFEHMHNKLVHFPLALGTAAALLLLLAHRWAQYRPAARLLLVGAALFAVGAYFSGKAQEEPFEHGPLAEFFERHETLGIASGITLAVGAALSFWRPAERWLWLYALALILLLSATGFFGGLLSHTEL